MPAFTLSKPVIAAVNGHALGLGLTLALQCNIRFFAADAQYGIVQVRRGVVGDAYSHWILPRLVGISKAAEILLSGATFDGRHAVRLGLGSRVLDADEVLPAALRRAHDIAENTAPASVAASERLLWDSFELDCTGIGARETEIHLRLMRHDDAKEGVRAFLERRAPVWTGSPADPTADPATRPGRTRDLDAGGAQVLDRFGGGFRRHAGRHVEKDPGGETGVGGVGGGGLHAVVGGDADHIDLVDVALPQPLGEWRAVSSAPSNPL